MIVEEFYVTAGRLLSNRRRVASINVIAVEPTPLGPRVRWTGGPMDPRIPAENSTEIAKLGAPAPQDLLECLSRYLACRWRDGSPRADKDWSGRLSERHRHIFAGFGPSSFAGWSWLWESAAIHIEEVGVPLDFRTTDTKEKFGTLRWYHDAYGDCDAVDNIIDCVEVLSGHICEHCGRPGRLRNGAWVKTLCDGHYKLRGER